MTMATQQKTRYLHLRKRDPQWSAEEEWPSVWTHGGVTVAWRFVGEGTVVYATARCSDSDNYCKRIGRSISTGRLNAGKMYELHATDAADAIRKIVAAVHDEERERLDAQMLEHIDRDKRIIRGLAAGVARAESLGLLGHAQR